MGGAYLGGEGPQETNSNPFREEIVQANTFEVGEVVRFNGTLYVLAQADTYPNSLAIGVVEAASSDRFTIVKHGTITLAGLTAGGVYYLSPSLAGATTLTEPSQAGQVSKVVMIAESTTKAFVFLADGDVIAAADDGISGNTVLSEENVGGGFAAGDVVIFDGSAWQKANATDTTTADVVGVIESVSAGLARIVVCGIINIPSASWSPGSIYFLSDATAGLLSLIEPTTENHISKPLLIAITATRGYVFNWRGTIIPGTASSFTNFNYVINGAFDYFQPTPPYVDPSAETDTANKWYVKYDGTIGAFTVSRQNFSPGQTEVTGDQAYYLKWDHTSAGSGSTYRKLAIKLGNVRTLAGKIITVSFWAKADAPRSVTSSIRQYFGIGGSPSADVQTNVGTHVLTTGWVRYSASVTVPSIAGKTIGTTLEGTILDNGVWLDFILPINTTMTINFANVQVEEGQNATDFIRRLKTVEGDGLLVYFTV